MEEHVFEAGALLNADSRFQSKRSPAILVALDLSPVSMEALQAGLSIAEQARGELILFHAIHLNLTPYGPANLAWLTSELKQEAMKQLESLSVRARQANLKANCVVENGLEADMILQTAKRYEADLIILESHPHGFIRRLFSRHIIRRVIEDSECPVLVVEQNPKKFRSKIEQTALPRVQLTTR